LSNDDIEFHAAGIGDQIDEAINWPSVPQRRRRVRALVGSLQTRIAELEAEPIKAHVAYTSDERDRLRQERNEALARAMSAEAIIAEWAGSELDLLPRLRAAEATVKRVRALNDKAEAEAVGQDEDGPYMLHEPVVRVADLTRALDNPKEEA
jgi:hypothetical protein